MSDGKRALLYIIIFAVVAFVVFVVVPKMVSAGPSGSPSSAISGNTTTGVSNAAGLPPTLGFLTSAYPNTGMPINGMFAGNASSGQASANVAGSAMGGPSVHPIASSFFSTALVNNSPANPSRNPISVPAGQEAFAQIGGIAKPIATAPPTPTPIGSAGISNAVKLPTINFTAALKSMLAVPARAVPVASPPVRSIA